MFTCSFANKFYVTLAGLILLELSWLVYSKAPEEQEEMKRQKMK